MSSFFSKIQNAWKLYQQVDMEQLNRLSSKLDLPALLKTVGTMDDHQLQGVVKMLSVNKKGVKQPIIEGDFYHLSETLSEEERSMQLRVRNFMEKEIKPIINEHWLAGTFPYDVIPKLAALNCCGITYNGYGCAGKSFLMEGILAMEIARIDTSISTFFGVQSGLTMGSIYLMGSTEQKEKWLPALREFKKIGAFGLTEPEIGSAAAGGLTTTAKRVGDRWILNGQKKWIGNATFADVIVIWASDEADGKVKGFLVEKGTPGLTVEKIEDKMALRIVQNGLITLKNCSVTETNRLPFANSFKDTATVLRMTRAGVAWQAVGCARGAYENALKYTMNRKQFGKPIAAFQLIQNHLVEMLSDLTAMQAMVFRLSILQDEGKLTDAHASLAKVFCSTHTRQVVAKAREVMGGNGILMEYDVARFVADAEAIYSYEGTKEINTLIVGRAITGLSAFV